MQGPSPTCELCGAPRAAQAHRSGACAYCGAALVAHGAHVEVAAADFVARREQGFVHGASKRLRRELGPSGLRLDTVGGDTNVAAMVVETAGPFADASVEAVFVSMTAGAELGVWIRRSSRGSYNVKIGSDHMVAIARVVSQSDGTPDMSWIGESSGRRGKPQLGLRTHVRVSMVKSRMVVVVNDRMSAAIDDPLLTNGKMGINVTARAGFEDQLLLERITCLVPTP